LPGDVQDIDLGLCPKLREEPVKPECVELLYWTAVGDRDTELAGRAALESEAGKGDDDLGV